MLLCYRVSCTCSACQWFLPLTAGHYWWVLLWVPYWVASWPPFYSNLCYCAGLVTTVTSRGLFQVMYPLGLVLNTIEFAFPQEPIQLLCLVMFVAPLCPTDTCCQGGGGQVKSLSLSNCRCCALSVFPQCVLSGDGVEHRILSVGNSDGASMVWWLLSHGKERTSSPWCTQTGARGSCLCVDS